MAAPPWHTLPPEEVAARLEVRPERGLDAAAVQSRRRRDGPNEIEEGGRRSLAALLLDQFRDFLIGVLLAAAAVSGALGELTDAVAILVIVVLNAAVGAFQQLRAQRAIAALRDMTPHETRVWREGRALRVPVREVVAGDVVLLEAGDAVPADLRLIEDSGLRVDESALTGESTPVTKSSAAQEREDLPLADRSAMAYRGTVVTRGSARGLAVATGMATELGRIAGMLGGAERTPTPLQRRLARFGRRLAVAVLGVCAVVFAVGVLRDEPPLQMFLTAVSLAVAAVPEALPAVVTVALALGARAMSRRHAVVRNLPAVETLGSVTCICADKTGTLTRNRMHLERIAVAEGDREALPERGDGAGEPWNALIRALALCNDVTPGRDGRTAAGDPTEVALWRAAREAGVSRVALERELPRLAALPFEAERMRMSTLHGGKGGPRLFTKGAPESVVPLCAQVASAAGGAAIDGPAWLARAEALAAEGFRVLAVATRRLERAPETPDPDALERELVLLGLVALLDPPRDEVPAAVRECREAGIAPVMITGDHPATALAIARRAGFDVGQDRVMTGTELAALDDEALAGRVDSIGVYARVDPEQKTRIVDALQRRGHFVAMTGDGVNDAPALERADIGVAMGGRGTDVAREASDLVLTDDDFTTIVAAVREGRRIHDNVRKFIKYTMTSNSGEIWTLLVAPLLGLPIPLLPIHILWINLVTDGLPGLALTAEPAEPGLMRRPPRPPGESLFARGLGAHLIWVGMLIGGLSIASQAWAWGVGSAHWQTVVFTVLTFCQLAHALVIRTETEPLWRAGPLGNRALGGTVLLTVGLQLGVIYAAPLNALFHTAPLSGPELALCFAAPLLVIAAVEIEKAVLRRGRRSRAGGSPASGGPPHGATVGEA